MLAATFFVVVLLCVVYSVRLNTQTSRSVAGLRALVASLRSGDFDDRLIRGEVVHEADTLLTMARDLGPRSARLGVLVATVYLLVSISELREERVQLGLGLCFSCALAGYAYTRAGFRRNETELKAVRRQIRGATRPSEKKLA